MKKAELIAMLAQVPDDAEIYIPEHADYGEDCIYAELRPPRSKHNSGDYWLLCGDYAPVVVAPVPAATPIHVVHEGRQWKCECGSGVFNTVNFAGAIQPYYKCTKCQSVYGPVS